MSELLKDWYSEEFLKDIAETSILVDKRFDKIVFWQNTLQDTCWEKKSLKERMRAISLAINLSIPQLSYQKKIQILKDVVAKMPKRKNSGLTLIIFPDFVELFGLNDFDISMDALEFFTEFGSSEFAIRQFIKADQKTSFKTLTKWSKSKNYHVRRLASEGCRPNLPWGEGLLELKKDPRCILPILENLKDDESEYVRRSVANNINDISKNHPKVVIELLQKWKKENISESLTRHALRTLLKKGNEDALRIIGIDSKALATNFSIQSFALKNNTIRISEDLIFDFALENKVANDKTRLEYNVYFLKKNGIHNKKIFQITTKALEKGLFNFRKKHSFKDLSTRKHYVGKHMISLVINGCELKKLEFNLI